MYFTHVLSQLAILGATSIVLSDGCVVPLADADDLVAIVEPYRRFELRARESHVDVFDESGQCFGRAVTLWRADDRRAFDQFAVQIRGTG